ncbi:MAG: zinc ribbon domain-containing protein [Clostridiales bacterium]|nr:zinc ribbon domain-containing protein [Clostridiales bacterium]
MYCHNCGASNPDGSKFCSSCGTSFDFSKANEVEHIEYQMPPDQKANSFSSNINDSNNEGSSYDSLAFGLSILGLFCCLPASIAALVIAAVQIAKGNNSKRIHIALVLGLLGVVLGLIMTIYSYSTGAYMQ